MEARHVPAWLEVGWAAWLAPWLPACRAHHGPQGFLRLGDLAIGVAVGSEGALLFSMPPPSVGIVHPLHTVDLLGGIARGDAPCREGSPP